MIKNIVEIIHRCEVNSEIQKCRNAETLFLHKIEYMQKSAESNLNLQKRYFSANFDFKIVSANNSELSAKLFI